MKLLDPSAVPKGKETKYLLILSAFFGFWSYASFADILDGAILMRGSSTPVTFDDDPFWYSFFWLAIVGVELIAFRGFCSAVIAFLRREKGTPD